MQLATVSTTHVPRKSAPRRRTRRDAVEWRDVLRCLQEDETRSCALTSFKAMDFDAETFRRIRKAREAIADGLTRAEDMLESMPRCARRDGEMASIRDVRRRLEIELWP